MYRLQTIYEFYKFTSLRRVTFYAKKSLLKYVFKYHYGNVLQPDLRLKKKDSCIMICVCAKEMHTAEG